MPELKRCPFCGSANVKYWEAHKSGSNIKCADCEAAGPWIRVTGDSYDASEAWNRRAITNPDRQQDQGSDCRQHFSLEIVKAITADAYRKGSGRYDGYPSPTQVDRIIEEVSGAKPQVIFPSFTVPTEPSPIVSPHSEGVFPKPGTEFVGIDDLTPHAFIDHNRLKGLARNCRNEGNRNSQQAAYHQLLDEIDRLPSTPPVTEQVQPVAVTTHGQLDLIRRDDSGKMFPLDGYLHRSVEAIPLFTSPPDQSVMHPISAAKAAHFEAKDALPAETAHRLGEMVGALETVLGLAYSKDGVKLGPDKGLEIKIVRARSLLAKLREVRG
jgi:Lar family restriction alleviation protein